MARVYERKFDHDEARRRRAEGKTYRELAAEFGVSETAVLRVCNPAAEAKMVISTRRSLMVPCEVCGSECVRATAAMKARHSPDGRSLCARCRGREKRQRLLFDDAGTLIAVRCSMRECANGERWQTPDHFPKGEYFSDVRPGGIHGICRSCNRAMRRKYRDRNKVPCSHGCGAMVLHENGGKAPECRPCAMKRVHEERRAREREAVSPLKEKEQSHVG